MTITDAGGLTATSSVSVTVDQTLTSIAVAPASVTLDENQAQQFIATAYDQFGNALSAQPTFTWAKTSGVGSINASGLYTAPATTGSAGITATSGLIVGSATITVTDPTPTFVLSTSTSSGIFAPGQSFTIAWIAANVSSDDVISLCLDKDTALWNGNEQWLEIDKVSAADGSGSSTFSMPNLAPGTYYVGGYMYNKVTHIITNSHLTSGVTIAPTTFTLTGPSSGTYAPGQSVTITWMAANVSSNDVITLCMDKDTTLWNGNEKWIEVDKVSAANGNGSYTFSMPDVASGSYYVGGYMYDTVATHFHQLTPDLGRYNCTHNVHFDRSQFGYLCPRPVGHYHLDGCQRVVQRRDYSVHG